MSVGVLLLDDGAPRIDASNDIQPSAGGAGGAGGSAGDFRDPDGAREPGNGKGTDGEDGVSGAVCRWQAGEPVCP